MSWKTFFVLVLVAGLAVAGFGAFRAGPPPTVDIASALPAGERGDEKDIDRARICVHQAVQQGPLFEAADHGERHRRGVRTMLVHLAATGVDR